MHTPLPREALLDAMETLFDLLAHEPHAAVRGVFSHHLFVSIGNSNHLFPHARLYGRSDKRAIVRCFLKISLARGFFEP